MSNIPVILQYFTKTRCMNNGFSLVCTVVNITLLVPWMLQEVFKIGQTCDFLYMPVSDHWVYMFSLSLPQQPQAQKGTGSALPPPRSCAPLCYATTMCFPRRAHPMERARSPR